MAGAGIEWRGAPELNARVRAIADPAARRDLLDEIGAMLVTSTRHRFEAQHGPDGTPWKPSLRAQEQGGKTLIDSARLMQSLTHNVLGTDAVEEGTNVAYAGIHQFGGTIEAKAAGGLRFRLANGDFVVVQRVTMPARPFLGIDEDDRAEITRIVDAHYTGRVQ